MYFQKIVNPRQKWGYQLARGVLLTLVVLPIVAFSFWISKYGPSLFREGLAPDVLYWHRWKPVSLLAMYVAYITGICVLLLLIKVVRRPQVSQSEARDESYRGLLRETGFFLAISAPWLIAITYYFCTGGFALYPERIVVRIPHRDVWVRSYQLQDVRFVEVGCHFRIFGKRDKRPVPIYDFHMKDGRTLAVFDAAYEDYADKKLYDAIITLDLQVKEWRIPKRYRYSAFGEPEADRFCYDTLSNWDKDGGRPDIIPVVGQLPLPARRL